jgi:hypothetical protein
MKIGLSSANRSGGGCGVTGRWINGASSPWVSLARMSLRTRHCCPRPLGSTLSRMSPSRHPPTPSPEKDWPGKDVSYRYLGPPSRCIAKSEALSRMLRRFRYLDRRSDPGAPGLAGASECTAPDGPHPFAGLECLRFRRNDCMKFGRSSRSWNPKPINYGIHRDRRCAPRKNPCSTGRGRINMTVSNWTEADSNRAKQNWSDYEHHHDLSEKAGQTGSGDTIRNSRRQLSRCPGNSDLRHRHRRCVVGAP